MIKVKTFLRISIMYINNSEEYMAVDGNKMLENKYFCSGGYLHSNNTKRDMKQTV